MPTTAPVWVEAGAAERAGDPEVGDVGPVVGPDQDVGRLEVAVHHPFVVGGGERRGQLAGDGDGARRHQRPLLPQQVAE